MKRFLLLFLFVVIIGGVVFFFGWLQLQIPANGYAVIFTKTHGWDEQVVEPGEFIWRWERLIPTNLDLYVFDIEQRGITVTVDGSLPSAAAYEQLVSENGALDYSVAVRITYQVEPAALPELAESSGVRPGELPAFYDQLEDEISDVAADAILAAIEAGEETSSVTAMHSRIARLIEERVPEYVNGVRTVSVRPTEIELPDMQLYRRAQELMAEVVEARADALEQAARERADEQVASDNELEMLERYGAILERYPVLLEYFRVGQEIQGDPLDLQSIIEQPRQ
ncbi:MAG: SPFH domain-containing protein [Spirochaetales bacterium]